MITRTNCTLCGASTGKPCRDQKTAAATKRAEVAARRCGPKKKAFAQFRQSMIERRHMSGIGMPTSQAQLMGSVYLLVLW